MKPEDIQDLKQLIEFLKENQVAEFDLDRGDLKIRLKFNPAAAPGGGCTTGECRRLGGGAGGSAARRLLRRLSLLRQPIPTPACTW